MWTAAPVNGRLASPLRPRGDDSYTRRQPEPPEGFVTQALRGSHVEPEEKTGAQTDGRWGPTEGPVKTNPHFAAKEKRLLT